MNIRKLGGIFDADRVAKMLGQLPPESQYVLSYYGTPSQLASRIGEALMRPAGKPANFESLPSSAKSNGPCKRSSLPIRLRGNLDWWTD